jgi:hypothetical protein
MAIQLSGFNPKDVGVAYKGQRYFFFVLRRAFARRFYARSFSICATWLRISSTMSSVRMQPSQFYSQFALVRFLPPNR